MSHWPRTRAVAPMCTIDLRATSIFVWAVTCTIFPPTTQSPRHLAAPGKLVIFPVNIAHLRVLGAGVAVGLTEVAVGRTVVAVAVGATLVAVAVAGILVGVAVAGTLVGVADGGTPVGVAVAVPW